MQKRNKVLAGVLTGALVLSAGPMALAATANYNDSSVTGGSAAWQDWVKEWETVAADYTEVSLTPAQTKPSSTSPGTARRRAARPPRRWFTSAPTRTT